MATLRATERVSTAVFRPKRSNMCGITGFFNSGPQNADDINTTIRQMAGTLRHRGPDAGGIWIDAASGIALGHRRLAIVDLSPTGEQPMISESGRYVIVLNGEIYNFRVLRRELEANGHRFRGTSDTEVMLAAFEEWGVVEAVPRFNGMFAFAVWDRREHILYLSRDRMGEKPLYYGYAGNTFLFGSELKALARHPKFQGAINRDALALHLRHNYIPAPYSIYQGIRKLSPGCTLTLRANDEPQVSEYWSLKDAARRGIESPLRCSAEEAVEQLDELIRDAVKLQMVADVPLGAFLSGGFDSSTIVGVMQALSNRPVRTFTIGFWEKEFDEAGYAREVARHLGTEHTELYVTPEEAMAVIPKLPWFYDEPFADSSQIPTYLVSQLARGGVTVSLSGDGGDELFGGYRIYRSVMKVNDTLRWAPPTLRRAAAWTLDAAVRTGALDGFQVRDGKYVSAGQLTTRLGNFANVLRLRTHEELYRYMMSQWRNPADLLQDVHEPDTAFTDRARMLDFPHLLQTMEYIDMGSYLPDDILVKVDRAAMAVSLESRVPLLDYRIVEFSWRTPVSMKLREEQGKWLLRQVAYRYVPRQLLERPKKGFSVPVDIWICGPLRDWAEALLDESRLRNEGVFNPAPIRKIWKDHVQGIKNSNSLLWDILMYQAWQETRCTEPCTADAPVTALETT
ncbi:MAG: asparagine synthase (glutamine-hydrolyzing) [Actinomycetota bacterium]